MRSPEKHTESILGLGHEASSHAQGLDDVPEQSKRGLIPVWAAHKANNRTGPFAVGWPALYFVGDRSGKGEEDNLAAGIEHTAGYGSGGVEEGLGRSPAILRGSPHFPPALKVEVEALWGPDVLARLSYERSQAEGLQRWVVVVGSKSEVLMLNQTDRSRQEEPSFLLARHLGPGTRDCR